MHVLYYQPVILVILTNEIAGVKKYYRMTPMVSQNHQIR